MKIRGSVALLFLLMWTADIGAQEVPPNFVIIMADDLGFADISCFGGRRYQTPHVDQLAREGLSLTDYHSNGPVCSPTRAALLTGRYQQRSGIDRVLFADPKVNRHEGLDQTEVTFADVLQNAGYATGVIGKWHLGYEESFNPVHQGFDYFRGYVSGNVCYRSHLDRMGIADWWRNNTLAPEEGYVTHLVTRHALAFIRAHRKDPFCLYVAHESVHSPYQGPADPPVRKLGEVGDLQSALRKDIPAAYAEMVTAMDGGVGEIMQALREEGLDRHTLVMFCSDNGATREGNNGPLRGYKGSLWEGGHRVPCIAWMPGTIAAGTFSHVPAMSMDLMPTLLDYAGLSRSLEQPLDGMSLRPVFEAGPETMHEPRLLFWQYGQSWAVRQGEWKLISPDGTGLELYNLQADVGETTNLAEANSDRVSTLQQEYVSWRATLRVSSEAENELDRQTN